MAKRYIHGAREDLIEKAISNNDIEKAKRIIEQNTYEPIFKEPFIHPEELSNNKKINESTKDIAIDMSILNIEISNSSYEFDKLMKTTNLRLENVKEKINNILEKKKDIEMFNCINAINLKEDNLNGDFSIIDSVICAKIINQNKTKIEIENIVGNGYEGNKYTLIDDTTTKEKIKINDNKIFKEEIIKTDIRENITDQNEISIYEYSRINADINENNLMPYINTDNIEASCCIHVKSNEAINSLKILAVDKKISVTSLETSMDGVSFKSRIKESLFLNDEIKDYTKKDYIMGSGLLCFPDAKEIKLYLQSTTYTNDIIGYEDVEIE